MKSIALILIIIISIGHESAAQRKIGQGDIILSGINLVEGQNTMLLPGGGGELKFVKRGESFSNVVLLDSLKNSIHFMPAETGGIMTCGTTGITAVFGNTGSKKKVVFCKPAAAKTEQTRQITIIQDF